MATNDITFTPNLHLSLLPSNYRVWTQQMNDNLGLIDAAITAFVSFNNLKGVWQNSTVYAVGDTVSDATSAVLYTSTEAHTSPTIPTTFAEDRADFPSRWAVTNAAATNRGAWLPLTNYNVNDFVFVSSENKYCMCIIQHVSAATFPPDLAAGKWLVIIDLSVVGSQVLPVLTPIVDANKFAGSDAGGIGYVVFDGLEAMNRLLGTLPVLKGGTGTNTSTGTNALVLSDSPALTGNPTAPTRLTGDDDTSIATTAFVNASITVAIAGAVAGYLPLTGGTLTGDLTVAHAGQTAITINAISADGSRPILDFQKQGNPRLRISTEGAATGQAFYETFGSFGSHHFFSDNFLTVSVVPDGVRQFTAPGKTRPTHVTGNNNGTFETVIENLNAGAAAEISHIIGLPSIGTPGLMYQKLTQIAGVLHAQLGVFGAIPGGVEVATAPVGTNTDQVASTAFVKAHALGSSFGAVKAGNQVVGAGVLGVVTNWSVNADPTGSFNAATGFWAPTVAGYYHITANASVQASIIGQIALRLTRFGIDTPAIVFLIVPAGGIQVGSVDVLMFVNAGTQWVFEVDNTGAPGTATVFSQAVQFTATFISP